MKAIVIGSGIAGLASALRIRKKGYEVQVYEAGPEPGGKLAQLESNGFRWDMGPSLFTMPDLVTELHDLFPELTREFEYCKLDTICNYFWEDGKSLSASSNTNDFAGDIEKAFNVPRDEVDRYLKDCKEMYDKVAPIFMEKSLHKWQTWVSKDVIAPLSSIGKLHLMSNLDQVNGSYFSEPHVKQLFNRYATYNGSSPFLTPGIMQVIPHLEFNLGAYFPKKGMRDIALSLYDLAVEAGVEFYFNQRVKKIIVCGGQARGVELDKEVIKSDLVISNSDVFFTYQNLLNKKIKRPKTINEPRSSSAFIFYWGMKETFPELDVHNILFSEEYEKEFETLFEKNELAEDLTVYIHISSKVNPEDAPAGGENWFVMVNAPRHVGQKWDEIEPVLRKRVLEKIERMLGKKISHYIGEEFILNPADIERRTGSHQGALYGTSSNSKLAAFLRHPNFSSNIKNLYHCGGSTHPGGGIPLCLNSAKIVSTLIPAANA